MGKSEAVHELTEALLRLGYPAEFAELLAAQLGGEKSIARLASYIRQAKPTSPEMIVDEMLAILEQREAWVEKKISERANAKMTQFYNRPREENAW